MLQTLQEMRYITLVVLQVIIPLVLWVVSEAYPEKETASLTWFWQTTHFELHLKVPCWVGGEGSKEGTSARTIRSRRLRGRLYARNGVSGTALARRSEVWRMW